MLYINAIRRHAFLRRALCLNVMSMRVICATCLCRLLTVLAVVFTVCLYPRLPIYSPLNGRVHSFQFRVINAAKNFLVYVLWEPWPLISVGFIPTDGISGSWSRYVVDFCRLCQTAQQSGCTPLHSTRSEGECQLRHSLAHALLLVFSFQLFLWA